MKVSDEWKGHAHDLRRIASMLKRRPTVDADEQIDTLEDLALDIEADAKEYAAFDEGE